MPVYITNRWYLDDKNFPIVNVSASHRHRRTLEKIDLYHYERVKRKPTRIYAWYATARVLYDVEKKNALIEHFRYTRAS